MQKLARNDLCPCNSGKKYKKCCLINNVADASADNIIDFSWQKLRKIDDDLNKKLSVYVMREFPEILIPAWDEFHCFKDDLPVMDHNDDIFICAFIPWLLYNWVPDLEDNLIKTKLDSTIAESFLLRYGYTLTNSEKIFINENLASHYSYYEILSIIPRRSLRVRDILRNYEFTVNEKEASKDLTIGSVVLGRVVTIEGCSIFIGMHPYALPARFIKEAVELKYYYSQGDFADNELYEYDLEIRELFLEEFEHYQMSMPQVFVNTDGEKIIHSKLLFDVNCSIEIAFEKLAVLDTISTKEEILEDAMYNENGQISEIYFSWMVKGNKIHQSWDNTIFGEIILSDKKLIVEVNSSERAVKAKVEIIKLMGTDVQYKNIILNSWDPELIDNGEAHNEGLLHIDQPEIQNLLKDMHKSFWQEWLDMEIPALGNQTPKEASKTKKGKELLEALFSEFHQQNLKIKEDDINQLKVDLAFLRKSLNML